MSEAALSTPDIHTGLSPTDLIDMALARGEGVLSDTGALRIETGARTGRSPADRFVVREPSSEDAIDWGVVNRPFDADRFDELWERVKSHASQSESWVQYLHVGEHSDHYLPGQSHHGNCLAVAIRSQYVYPTRNLQPCQQAGVENPQRSRFRV